MPDIKLLCENLINKIAAGEVIERPFSVIKELIENSIDASATQIHITIKNGGTNYISVLDNGKGMHKDDVIACVERHATSKLKEIEDLEKIATLGFRGEALAAICSVSKFQIISCEDEEIGGYFVDLEAGKLQNSGGRGFSKGTKIIVEDLFFNTPARKKFLKSEKTEYGYIIDYIQKIALSHHHIQFKLTHNSKLVLHSQSTDALLKRIEQIHGAQLANDLIEIKAKEHYLSIEGYCCKPEASSASKRQQILYVNNRYVKIPFVSQAVQNAYKTLLMKHQNPIFFLKLEIDPKEIDVNVHPNKTEIRFANQSLVFTIISDKIKSALRNATRAGFHFALHQSDQEQESKIKIDDQDAVNNAAQGANYAIEEPASEFIQTDQKRHDQEQHFESESTSSNNPLFASLSPKSVNTDGQRAAIIERRDEPFATNLDLDLKENGTTIPLEKTHPYTLIGQFRKYILTEAEGALIIIDKHAAHERILFEEIRVHYHMRQIASHQLAIPDLIELSAGESVTLYMYLDKLQEIGFQINPYSNNSYAISEIPAIIKDKNIKKILKETLYELAEFDKSSTIEKSMNQIFETLACHSAIRGEHTMTKQEMDAMLHQLNTLDIDLYCPHGRPIIVKLDQMEFDKKFKRIL